MEVHELWCVEEMKNPDQVQQLAKELLWLVHAIRLWTHAVNNKKQASRGLKKTTNDAR
jgi:hypothetical protein